MHASQQKLLQLDILSSIIRSFHLGASKVERLRAQASGLTELLEVQQAIPKHLLRRVVFQTQNAFRFAEVVRQIPRKALRRTRLALWQVRKDRRVDRVCHVHCKSNRAKEIRTGYSHSTHSCYSQKSCQKKLPPHTMNRSPPASGFSTARACASPRSRTSTQQLELVVNAVSSIVPLTTAS